MDGEKLAFAEPRVIEKVDAKTGKLYKVAEYTQDELADELRKATRGIGRDPSMLGVRTRGLPDEAKALVRKAVYDAGPQVKNITQV